MKPTSAEGTESSRSMQHLVAAAKSADVAVDTSDVSAKKSAVEGFSETTDPVPVTMSPLAHAALLQGAKKEIKKKATNKGATSVVPGVDEAVAVPMDSLEQVTLHRVNKTKTQKTRKRQKKSPKKKKKTASVATKAGLRSSSVFDHVEQAGTSTPSDLSVDAPPHKPDDGKRNLGSIILD
jgi:hypothetical protein